VAYIFNTDGSEMALKYLVCVTVTIIYILKGKSKKINLPLCAAHYEVL